MNGPALFGLLVGGMWIVVLILVMWMAWTNHRHHRRASDRFDDAMRVRERDHQARRTRESAPR